MRKIIASLQMEDQIRYRLSHNFTGGLLTDVVSSDQWDQLAEYMIYCITGVADVNNYLLDLNSDYFDDEIS